MSYKAVFFQRWFETKPILRKKKKKFRGQKSKIGCFYEFIPGFPKRLGTSWNIENGVTIMWSVKSMDLRNLPLLKFREKTSQLWCPGNQCGQLSRSLKIWVKIFPYDGYHWQKIQRWPKLASYIDYLLKLWILASKIEIFQSFCLFGNKYGCRKIESICKILLIQ